MELAIRTKTMIRAMIIAVLLLTLAGLAARFTLYVFGDGPFMRPLSLFDVGAERNIPTWFESMQFMLCSVLLAVIAVANRQWGQNFNACCTQPRASPPAALSLSFGWCPLPYSSSLWCCHT